MFYFYFVCLFVLYSALIWIHDYALNKNRCYIIYIAMPLLSEPSKSRYHLLERSITIIY